MAYSWIALRNDYCESKGNIVDDEEVQAQILIHHTKKERLSNIPEPVSSCPTEGEYVHIVSTKLAG